MSRVGKVARRTFLVGSAATLGGVVFGTYLYRRPFTNPLLIDLAEGEAAITPYVRIDADGVTLITPRADFGQGGYSSQATIIAEELDVDPSKVRLDPGPPSPAYFNGAVLSEAVPFAPYDQGWLAEHVRGFMAVPAKFLGLQITGGSSSTPDGFDKLRMAGAVARETLKEAAARQFGVPRTSIETDDGQVILPDGRRLDYTALASVAATLEPVQDIMLRTPSEWRLIGKAGTKRVDMVERCTGRLRYGIDCMLPDMVYASVRANPGLGGEVVSYDAKAAETMRGVIKVLPVSHGIAVIADNTWRAIQAVNAVDVKWGPAPYPASSSDLYKGIAAAFEGSHDSRNRDDGDVEAGSLALIEAEYRTPYLAHAPLEPANAVVMVSDDACDVWTGTQIPGFVRSHAAKITGLSEDRVHVHVQPMGGSFGARLEDTHVLQTIELAMAMKGRPVKMTWSREEDFAHDYPRPAAIARGRGRVGVGHVNSLDMSIASASVGASWFGRIWMAPPGPDPTIVAGAWDQPFSIPNYRVTGYRASETVPVSSWRSVGASGNGFFHDAFLDELIHAAEADPLVERIRLCADDVSRKVLEAVGEMCGWTGPHVETGVARGVGFTLSFGVPVAQVVQIRQTSGGIRVEKVWVVVDVGRVIEPLNLEAQVMGGVVFGLGHAMNCELTYANGAPEQANFDAYQGMRINQCPEILVKALENGPKLRGIGEPGVPPAAPALANAIFALTGMRVRELPLSKAVSFV